MVCCKFVYGYCNEKIMQFSTEPDGVKRGQCMLLNIPILNEIIVF